MLLRRNWRLRAHPPNHASLSWRAARIKLNVAADKTVLDALKACETDGAFSYRKEATNGIDEQILTLIFPRGNLT